LPTREPPRRGSKTSDPTPSAAESEASTSAVDGVEIALAAATGVATREGRWEIVAALARELEARRVAPIVEESRRRVETGETGDNVVAFDAAKRRGRP
jgi:hypothetical protein